MIETAERAASSLGPSDDRAIAARIEAAAGAAGQAFLVELMDERHPVYAGRGATTTLRLRGYAMAAFERVGLPDAALMFLVEELQSGVDAYPVAAAARGLRGLDGRERRLVPFLLRAVDNIRDRDDSLTFDAYQPTWPMTGGVTTALAEILRTIAWLGPQAAFALSRLLELQSRSTGYPAVTLAALDSAIEAVQGEPDAADDADCCGSMEPSFVMPEAPRRRSHSIPLDTRLEDQSGARSTYREALVGTPTIVAFFYTRCTNPNKCSLTITKLARLGDAIDAAQLSGRIRIAGITYDPAFDLPPRLRAYGENRGMRFDGDQRLLRVTRGWRSLAAYFDLAVSYGPATVNRHRIEAFVVDREGAIAASFTRLQWDVSEVLDTARVLIEAQGAARPDVA